MSPNKKHKTKKNQLSQNKTGKNIQLRKENKKTKNLQKNKPIFLIRTGALKTHPTTNSYRLILYQYR